ncbi:alpha/beta hydrolase [Sphingobium boeckii]|uniref:Acetyl esterase/lipase n=1 Tax=Sphingobium boeckii TaxID=1082345 RepID=A0A7W9AIC0_9SPHN|nr:alpha/beta hydrolase [Sphingobium boeckii]MBB5685951.1 acetyl esterase/lipase [Sphingobium boeckii]
MSDVSRRNVVKASGAVALAVAASPGAMALVAAKAASPEAVNPRKMIHPELVEAAKRMPTMPEGFSFSNAMLPQLRGMAGSLTKEARSDVSVTERRIPGARNAPDVAVYIINARAGTTRPAILHMHGGGFILGSAKDSIRDLQDIAHSLDCVIVTVEYRLAPETRWQGALDDNYAGLKWLYANAAELGADRAKIAVMGESAGGGHAALLAIASRDRGEVPIAFQMLVYPMLDDRTGSSRKTPGHVGFIGWRAHDNVFGWRSLLGQEPGGDSVPADAVPARTLNLAGLPPTFIGVGAIDLFVDEDIAFARRLADAGVSTELNVVPGAFHGFDAIAPETSIAKQFTSAKLNALRRAFGLPATI